MFFKKETPAPAPTIPNELYGILKYSSQNIGDEIQSVAAMRFLPKIDYYCHRERLDQFHLHECLVDVAAKALSTFRGH